MTCSINIPDMIQNICYVCSHKAISMEFIQQVQVMILFKTHQSLTTIVMT